MQESKPRAHIIVHSQIGSRKCKADDNFCNQIIMSDEGEFHLNGAQKTQESAIMVLERSMCPQTRDGLGNPLFIILRKLEQCHPLVALILFCCFLHTFDFLHNKTPYIS